MLGWMAYVVVVTTILGGAAFVAERAAQMRKAPTRWLWAASMLASVIAPIVMSLAAAPTAGADMTAPTPRPAPTPLSQAATRLLQPSAWLPASAAPLAPASRPIGLDAILLWLWLAASAAIMLAVALGGARLHRRKRAWTLRLMQGAPVYVSEDVGPAVVDLFHPSVVVPRWLVDAAPQTQALVLAHEQSHLDANDARLLALAVVLLATVPWSLPLWWQLRRLRFAIEVDCDARVLRAGHDVSRYGETLIMVGARQSGRVAAVAAMSESSSFLEQRIRKMLRKPTRYAWAFGAALAGLGVVMAAAAAEVRPPPGAGLLQAGLDTAGAPAPSPASDVPMKRYADGEWGFALDVPSRWNAFPPVTSQNPNELIRFLSNEHGTHEMLVIRDPYDPAVGVQHLLERVQRGLATQGFAHFTTGETRIGSSQALFLDFDKARPDGKTWSCREYYIPDGALIYVLGFGTTDKAAMFDLYERVAQSFTFDRSGS